MTEEIEKLVNSGNLEQAAKLLEGPIQEERTYHKVTFEEPSVAEQPTEQPTAAEDYRLGYPPDLAPTKPDGFDFQDPYELLLFLDDDVRDGNVKLHPWQIQKLLDFASGGQSDETPFQALVRACNGSGKDKYIIAPCAVWLLMRFCFSRCVITSSSGVQLDNQTDAYINQLCLAANRKIDPKIWKINYRYYECLPTQSQMILFATDEPGKAEGYHPLKFGAKMAIFVSEDKTVPDEINEALNKCSGYTHRVHVSTPGPPLGHFFDMCQLAVNRKSIKSVHDVTPIDYIQYHITAYDCPHISKNFIEQMKRDLPGGENGAAFKSQILAEFGSTDEMVVIPSHYVWLAHNRTPEWIKEEFNTGGLDLAAGGAETVLTVRNGNKVLAVVPFRFDNTEDTIDFLNVIFREYDLIYPEALVFADCVGIGKPMLDRLKRQGWVNIRYIDSRGTSRQPKIYANIASELWFNTRKLFERNEVILLKDTQLIKQLCGRYYKLPPSGKHQLLTKAEQKSKGYPSPDRADSLNLAFWNFKSNYNESISKLNAPFDIPHIKKPVADFDIRVWANDSNNVMPNPSKDKDFSYLQEEIRRHNQQKLQKTV